MQTETQEVLQNIIRRWKGMPREVVEFLSMEILKTQLDMAWSNLLLLTLA